MPALGGPVMVSALLLLLAGVLKAWRPGNTVRALRGLRLPASDLLVRLLAVGEVAIGVLAIAVGNRTTALLLAFSYLGFAGFVILAMARGGPLSSCGCFGTPDTPPTVTHVLVTLAASTVGFAAAASPVGDLFRHLGGQPLLGLPFVALTACSVWFAYTALSILPRTAGYVRQRR